MPWRSDFLNCSRGLGNGEEETQQRGQQTGERFGVSEAWEVRSRGTGKNPWDQLGPMGLSMGTSHNDHNGWLMYNGESHEKMDDLGVPL